MCVCPVVPPVPPPRSRQPLRPGGPGPVARSVPGGGVGFDRGITELSLFLCSQI